MPRSALSLVRPVLAVLLPVAHPRRGDAVPVGGAAERAGVDALVADVAVLLVYNGRMN